MKKLKEFVARILHREGECTGSLQLMVNPGSTSVMRSGDSTIKFKTVSIEIKVSSRNSASASSVIYSRLTGLTMSND